MKRLTNRTKIILGTLLVATMATAAPLMQISPAFAGFDDGVNSAKTDDMTSKPLTSQDGLINEIVNIFLYVVGVVAVVMVVYGGFRYITSGGDSNKLTSAKNTILYAVVGLVIVIFAYAIVNWVAGKFS